MSKMTPEGGRLAREEAGSRERWRPVARYLGRISAGCNQQLSVVHHGSVIFSTRQQRHPTGDLGVHSKSEHRCLTSPRIYSHRRWGAPPPSHVRATKVHNRSSVSADIWSADYQSRCQWPASSIAFVTDSVDRTYAKMADRDRKCLIVKTAGNKCDELERSSIDVSSR